MPSFSVSSYLIQTPEAEDISFAIGNRSSMLIGRPIAIMYFLARKITAEYAEERKSS